MRETWRLHPDQLLGKEWAPYMLIDAMAAQQYLWTIRPL